MPALQFTPFETGFIIATDPAMVKRLKTFADGLVSNYQIIGRREIPHIYDRIGQGDAVIVLAEKQDSTLRAVAEAAQRAGAVYHFSSRTHLQEIQSDIARAKV
jgi:hypothetical protein